MPKELLITWRPTNHEEVSNQIDAIDVNKSSMTDVISTDL